ncbi:virulence-associated E family protein [Tolypothrix tenuis PCC 7101]|uniref:Virulence-associated E family protein n=1 Tax=Tolypothrix tenuis PCC 7101 TaxID=231146 RepID=A0A1Z4N446_9CYAN|nr:DUF3854 domain-containing protein [Aulosira sp. FACHB-113]BAZ00523.1 virulence-associated E family protein [Tolypothrix tenuis PCC 7101]BAZ75555.1 virulence-associated E family protein [Aulosira laxa NIES-50]
MATITDLFGRVQGYDADVTQLANDRDIPASWIEANCQRVERWDGKPTKGWLIGKHPRSQQFRPDEPRVGKNGKTNKYLSPTGSTPGLFTPSVPPSEVSPYGHAYRVLTEGHFKAIKAASEGLPVESVAGVWMGRTKDSDGKKVLIDDIRSQIKYGIKDFIIAFDADAATNKDVIKASIELASLIIEAGATCKIATGQWTVDEGKGMDDFISKNGVEEMRARLEKALTLPEFIERFGDGKKTSNKGKHATAIDEIASFYGDRIRLNLVSQSIERDSIPYDADNAFYDISSDMGLDLADTFAFKAVSIVAERNAYSPVVEYLESLKSVHPDVFRMTKDDTKSRVVTLIKNILSLHDELAATLMMRTLISAVARAKDPGCKVDTMCVLYGAQGFNKSTYWRILTGEEWFGTSLSGVRDDKEVRKMHSKWIHEFAELARIFTRTDQESFKTYLDTQVDDVDVKYKRQIASLKRRSILVASTNRQDILRDSTGDRRYWVIAIHQRIDPHKVRQYRSELWALANHLYALDEQWWLTDDEQARSSANNEAFKPMDVLSDGVRDYCWLQGDECFRPSVTSVEVWQAIYPNESKSPDRKDLYPINEALTAIGYFCGKPERWNGKTQRVWRQKAVTGLLHPCYEAVTPAMHSVEPICNNSEADKTFSGNSGDDVADGNDNSLESFVEDKLLQNDLKPITDERYSLVTAPVTARNSLEVVTKTPPTIPYNGYEWEIFTPEVGDKVEILTPKHNYKRGDVDTITRVQGENIYFSVDTRTLAGRKGVKEVAFCKMDVRLVSPR